MGSSTRMPAVRAPYRLPAPERAPLTRRTVPIEPLFGTVAYVARILFDAIPALEAMDHLERVDLRSITFWVKGGDPVQRKHAEAMLQAHKPIGVHLEVVWEPAE